MLFHLTEIQHSHWIGVSVVAVAVTRIGTHRAHQWKWDGHCATYTRKRRKTKHTQYNFTLRRYGCVLGVRIHVCVRDCIACNFVIRISMVWLCSWTHAVFFRRALISPLFASTVCCKLCAWIWPRDTQSHNHTCINVYRRLFRWCLRCKAMNVIFTAPWP